MRRCPGASLACRSSLPVSRQRRSGSLDAKLPPCPEERARRLLADAGRSCAGGVMATFLISIAVLALTFGSGMLGLYLQKRLPAEHMSSGSRDMILAVIGLITLLLALVLGTLVGNTYAFFAMQKSELETMASRALMVDQALAQYGREAKPARDKLREALGQSYD